MTCVRSLKRLRIHRETDCRTQDATKEIQSDENVFDATKMYSFFNPLSSMNMKVNL